MGVREDALRDYENAKVMASIAYKNKMAPHEHKYQEVMLIAKGIKESFEKAVSALEPFIKDYAIAQEEAKKEYEKVMDEERQKSHKKQHQ